MYKPKGSTESAVVPLLCWDSPLTWSVNFVINAVVMPHRRPMLVPPRLTTKNDAKPLRICKRKGFSHTKVLQHLC